MATFGDTNGILLVSEVNIKDLKSALYSIYAGFLSHSCMYVVIRLIQRLYFCSFAYVSMVHRVKRSSWLIRVIPSYKLMTTSCHMDDVSYSVNVVLISRCHIS